MPLQILLSVDKSQVSVAPGATVELGVTAQNLMTRLDQVAVRIDGIPQDWVRVIPEYLPVFGQGTATARVVLGPPRDPANTLAGSYPLRVHATSQENPGQEGETTSELEIQLVGDYALSLQRVESSDPQTENYSVTVQNHANSQLQLRLSGGDDEDAFWCKFEPFQLAVPAGGPAVSTLSARPKRPRPPARAVPFHVAAAGNYVLKSGALVGAPAQRAVGLFSQALPAALKIAIVPDVSQAGVYHVQLSNPGAQPITAQLTAEDAQNSLEFQFESATLALSPQSSRSARLFVRPRTPLQSGEQLARVFSVSARSLGDQGQADSAEARFVQREPARQQLTGLIVLVALLALLVLIALAAILVLR